MSNKYNSLNYYINNDIYIKNNKNNIISNKQTYIPQKYNDNKYTLNENILEHKFKYIDPNTHKNTTYNGNQGGDIVRDKTKKYYLY
jgi:hypothetical protein